MERLKRSLRRSVDMTSSMNMIPPASTLVTLMVLVLTVLLGKHWSTASQIAFPGLLGGAGARVHGAHARLPVHAAARSPRDRRDEVRLTMILRP